MQKCLLAHFSCYLAAYTPSVLARAERGHRGSALLVGGAGIGAARARTPQLFSAAAARLRPLARARDHAGRNAAAWPHNWPQLQPPPRPRGHCACETKEKNHRFRQKRVARDNDTRCSRSVSERRKIYRETGVIGRHFVCPMLLVRSTEKRAS